MTQRRTGNILLVSNYPSDVGYAWWLMEHFWVLLAEHFSQKGQSAYLAYPSITKLPSTIKESSIKTVELNVPGQTESERQTAKSFIKQHNITDLYLTDRAWFSVDYARLRAWGVKNIVVHDHTPGDRPAIGGLKGCVKALRHRLPLACADAQLCVSDLMKKRSIHNGRIPSERCQVVQNGIPPVTPSEHTREALLSSLDIPADSTVCITTGRAHPYKRFDFIIDVAAELQRTLPNNKLVFLLIGNGPALEKLREKVAKAGLERNIRLPGFRSDAKEFLSAADFAMHAALGEGFSLSIVEYMSAALPVLVPDIPSVKQAIDHDLNGFVYSKDDVKQAADYIRALYSSESYRKKLGANAKRKADARYTLDNCTREFKAACQQVF
ncbi:glycosyltransferase family 4 protein [Marinobacter fuscus]|nr:glycosyltransferase family 4 protein [Marinobacter fuscus]